MDEGESRNAKSPLYDPSEDPLEPQQGLVNLQDDTGSLTLKPPFLSPNGPSELEELII